MTSLALVALIKRSTTGKTMSMLHTKLKIDKLFTFPRPNHRLGTRSLGLDEEYGMKSILEEQGTFLADYGVKVILQGNIMSSTSRYFRFHILVVSSLSIPLPETRPFISVLFLNILNMRHSSSVSHFCSTRPK